MQKQVTVAEYLFTRLKQLGIKSIHGVPGDCNLTLLDFVEPTDLRWIGSTNELNAGYASDGYARIKGVGALITTFGVGELSVINAIAGSFAERAAVVHIVGTPARATQESRLRVHHTFCDGEFGHFAQIATYITVAQANLWDPRTVPDEIDRVLIQCLTHSRPVYIAVPVDMVTVQVSAQRLNIALSKPVFGTTDASYREVLEVMLGKIAAASQPLLLVDGESRAMDIVTEVQRLSISTRWPTWTTTFGKGLLDETLGNFKGVFKGKYDLLHTQNLFENSDLTFMFGPHLSTSNTYSGSAIPNARATITFSDAKVLIDGTEYRDIPVKQLLADVCTKLEELTSGLEYRNVLPPQEPAPPPIIQDDHSITQDRLWDVIGTLLQSGDIVVAETGTAGHGARNIRLPPQTRMFAPATWLSIGYSLPAAQGAALAQEEMIAASKAQEAGLDNSTGRTILFIGDGSFQLTCQELSTIIRLQLDVIVFLLNNDGYTIERCIHGRQQSYNDVASWRYLKAPDFFGADVESVYTSSVRTWGELKASLHHLTSKCVKGLSMVEIVVDKEDVPPGPLLDMLVTQKSLAKVANGVH